MNYLALSIPGFGNVYHPSPIIGGGMNALNRILGLFVGLFYFFAIILALGIIVWAGVRWITSQGDKQKLQDARNKITYAIAGLIIVLLAFLIVNTIGSFFGFAKIAP